MKNIIKKTSANNGWFCASGGVFSCDNSAKYCIFAPVPSGSGPHYLQAKPLLH